MLTGNLVMMRTRLPDAKAMFFDRKAVQIAVGRAAKDRPALSKAGMLVRSQERRIVRPVKRETTVSKPGAPPKSHRPTDINLRTVLYGFDPILEGTIVGPIGIPFARAGEVPEALEYGGSVQKRVRLTRRMKTRRVTEKQKRAFQKKINREIAAKQAGQAGPFEIIDRRKPKHTETRTLRIAARPFMSTALKQVAHKLPQLWEYSVR